MNAVAPTSSPAPGTQARAQPASTITSDYETFLALLTTQLENQDPLNPQDSDQLAVQLATFSGVEQQTLTNELLADLSARIGLGNLAEIGSWVGMEVLAPTPVGFAGDPIDLAFSVPRTAELAELVVLAEDGREIQRLPLSPGQTEVIWTGADGAGGYLPHARYHFTVEAVANGAAVSGGPVAAYREVVEVRNTAGGAVLVDRTGAQVISTEVEALRRPT